jgi:membrane-associated HD superfamily phosphohydrolase
MDLRQLNLWAILAATVSAFVVGGLWYSVLFGKAWVKANGFTDAPKGNGRTFAIAFVLTLVMAFNLAMFLNDSKTNVSWGATAGFLAGFGWIAMGIGVVAVFERKPLSYVLINGGYMTVALVLMGAIIGLWR